MHRRQVMAAWRPCGSNLPLWRTNGIETFVQKTPGEIGAAQGQMPRREEGRRNS